MATFSSLFNFLDLSANESELSSPPDSSNLSDLGDIKEEDNDDAWYNRPSDLEDLDNDSIKPCLTLLTSLAFTMPKTTRKEHSTGARVKAVYMLE
jgi:hypothetical protein